TCSDTKPRASRARGSSADVEAIEYGGRGAANLPSTRTVDGRSCDGRVGSIERFAADRSAAHEAADGHVMAAVVVPSENRPDRSHGRESVPDGKAAIAANSVVAVTIFMRASIPAAPEFGVHEVVASARPEVQFFCWPPAMKARHCAHG